MKITAESRSKIGKGGAKRVRFDGKVPAIVYGRGEEARPIQIDEKAVRSIDIGEHLTLELDEPLDVIAKEIQINPVTSRIIHIDFQHLHRGEKVKAKVPVVLEGTDMAIKIGGVLEQMLSEIEIECLPEDIPEAIKIDVSGLKIGDTIHLKDLSVGKIRFIHSLDTPVAMVGAPKVVKEEKPVPKEEAVVEEGKGEAVTEEEKVVEEKGREKK